MSRISAMCKYNSAQYPVIVIENGSLFLLVLLVTAPLVINSCENNKKNTIFD